MNTFLSKSNTLFDFFFPKKIFLLQKTKGFKSYIRFNA